VNETPQRGVSTILYNTKGSQIKGEYNIDMFDHQDTLFMEKYKKKSPRNEKWDYSSPAIYFVTFCTYKHGNRFGNIEGNEILLSDIGVIVNDEILKTFEIRENIKLHDYVIMPNHVHILFEILPLVETPRWGVSNEMNTVSNEIIIQSIKQIQNFHKPQIASLKWKKNTVGSIINQIKSISTKRIKKIPKEFGWQGRYYDEIIKDKNHYWKTKRYFKNNVVNWEKDEYA